MIDDRLEADVLVSRAAALVPRIRERARATEQLRRLPDDTMGELRTSGLTALHRSGHGRGSAASR